MAQEKPHVKHTYDVWHLAKGNCAYMEIFPIVMYLVLHFSIWALVKLFIYHVFNLNSYNNNLMSAYIGEKKKLLKAAKTKTFRAIQPWIGVQLLN